MKIAIGCDHRGVKTKKIAIVILKEDGYQYKDFGCGEGEAIDYPDIAEAVARAVAGGEYDKGILICSTGIGMCIVANKMDGIRAALCHNTHCAYRARHHNDANILCLGDIDNSDELKEMVISFLKEQFDGGRHKLRIDKINIIENKTTS